MRISPSHLVKFIFQKTFFSHTVILYYHSHFVKSSTFCDFSKKNSLFVILFN
nr:MAG TPA: hypothetical protein [Caudoviricetes sp.]